MDQVGLTTPRQGSQSTERLLAVLEAVAERADGAEPAFVAERLGLSTSTTYRMLRTLLDRGYLRRHPGGSRYILGPAVSDLGFAQARQHTATPRVRAFLKQLHDEQGGAAYLAVLHHDQVLLAHIHDSPEHPRVRDLHVGYVANTQATAFGKLLLRNRSTEELAMRSLPEDLSDAAVAEMRRGLVTRDEIAYEIEEYAPGVACLAAPVRSRRGTTIGAVALSVTPREIAERQAELERAVRRTALLVSAQLES